MKKSMVRKLALMLVFALMLKTFMADYNSLGVRAETEDATLNAIGDTHLTQELVDAIENANESLTVENANGEDFSNDDQTTQGQGVEEVNKESQESDVAVTGDTADQSNAAVTGDTSEQAGAQATVEEQGNNGESGDANDEAGNSSTAGSTDESENAATVGSTDEPDNSSTVGSTDEPAIDEPAADPSAEDPAVEPAAEGDEADAPAIEPAEGEGEEAEQSASYTVNIYIRKLGGRYAKKPSRVIKSGSDEDIFGNNAKVGKEYTITPQTVVSAGNAAYTLDEDATQLTSLVMSEDPSENVFKLYYVPPTEYESVAFYILLPEYKVPTNSDAQPEEEYFPEKGMDYSYEKWTGKAFVDLYSLPNRDSNGNYWSKDNAPENSILLIRSHR